MNTAQLYLVNKDIGANELETVKNTFERWILVSKISLLALRNSFSESDKTISKLSFFERKLYGRRFYSQYKG